MPPVDPLVDLARRGDARALEALLASVAPSIHRFGMRMCRNENDADDVVQDTLLAIATHLGEFEGRSSVSSWAFALARSACTRRRRGLKNRPTEGEEAALAEPSPTPSPEDAASDRELALALAGALHALPDEQREVVLLRDVEGLSAPEAADALGISSTDRRGLTVTGGLPYFGGPGSNYLTHSIAAMVDVLRNDPGSFGLTSGVGMHMTKHAFGVWSTSPPGNGTSGVSVLGDDTHVQTSLDAHTRYPIVDRVAGAAKVATYSVVHGRDGEPTWALLVCDVPEGERCYARVEAGDPDGLAFLMALESEEWVGRTVSLTPDGHGRNVARA